MGKYANYGGANCIDVDTILAWKSVIKQILGSCPTSILRWDSLRGAFSELFSRMPLCNPNHGKRPVLDSAEECATGLKRLFYCVRKMKLNEHKMATALKRSPEEASSTIEELVKMVDFQPECDEPEVVCETRTLKRESSLIPVASSAASWPSMDSVPEAEPEEPEVPETQEYSEELGRPGLTAKKFKKTSFTYKGRIHKKDKVRAGDEDDHGADPASTLPEGYTKEQRTRRSGSSEGQHYFIYYAPDGKALKSMKQVYDHAKTKVA